MNKYYLKNKHDEIVGTLNFDEDCSAYEQKKTMTTLTDQGFKLEKALPTDLTSEQRKVFNDKEFIKAKDSCFEAVAQSGHFSYNILAITLSDVKIKFGTVGIELIKKEVPEITRYIDC